jgi:hypothetical protein
VLPLIACSCHIPGPNLRAHRFRGWTAVCGVPVHPWTQPMPDPTLPNRPDGDLSTDSTHPPDADPTPPPRQHPSTSETQHTSTQETPTLAGVALTG